MTAKFAVTTAADSVAAPSALQPADKLVPENVQGLVLRGAAAVLPAGYVLLDLDQLHGGYSEALRAPSKPGANTLDRHHLMQASGGDHPHFPARTAA